MDGGCLAEKHIMVGAGSLVKQNTRIPSGEVIFLCSFLKLVFRLMHGQVGNPAKFLRSLQKRRSRSSPNQQPNYINLAQVHAAENAKSFDCYFA
ncbi:hypothetical protein HU200_052128 [Digitaria exilis]|uniref:Uncharacterized protein n=1 Tax=Digitaria exilis TaxID=1010633 RepID=A0A835ASH9_9POAL|nr:hypothetical protein HU200_052128 [Digitaria exilis]